MKKKFRSVCLSGLQVQLSFSLEAEQEKIQAAAEILRKIYLHQYWEGGASGKTSILPVSRVDKRSG